MPTKPKCSICANTAILAQVDDLLNSNSTAQKEIAEMFNISRFAISRHFRHGKNAPAAGSGSDVEAWLSRALDQYNAAVFDSDQRGAIQALVAGLRACEAQAKQRERDAEVAEEAGEDDGKISISNLDDVCAMFDQAQASDDPVDQAQIKITLDKARLLCKPDMVAVFYRAYENLRFAEDLLTWAATWEPEKKGNSDGPVQTGRCAN